MAVPGWAVAGPKGLFKVAEDALFLNPPGVRTMGPVEPARSLVADIKGLFGV